MESKISQFFGSLASFFSRNQAGQKLRHIDIVEHDLNWPKIFQKEAEQIKKALGSNLLQIHHFGSTSVQGLAAKPKVDILVVVKKFSNIDIISLKNIAYKFDGEVVPSAQYFKKRNFEQVNLHLFEEGNPLIERNLIFRDRLIEDKNIRREYAKLKSKLAATPSYGMEYCKAKTDFINSVVDKVILDKRDSC